MSGTKENTVHTCCPECDIGPFSRNHYFTGKLLVERDFRQEQAYYVDKLRLHTQRLHGLGVVCGLKVKQHENPGCRNRFVCIEPGLAIDCCGHDIFVPEEDCIDLTQFDSVKALLAKNDGQPHALQIRICYKECPSEPIPVLYDDCGCDDTQCAPNRILESYEVDVVVDPATTAASPEAPGLAWKNSINVAHASQVALHDATQRLYILTDDSPGFVYQVSTDNFNMVTSHPLGQHGLALAVSNGGNRVYVVTTTGTQATDPLQLHVLDATLAGLPLVQKPIDIDATKGKKTGIVLAVAPAPDQRLLALVTSTGDLLQWDTTKIDSAGQPTAPTTVTKLGANQNSLVLSHDGATAYVAGADIQVVHLANQNVDVIKGPTHGELIALANVTTAAGNWLAVAVADDNANANPNQLYLVDPVTSKALGAPLAHPPVGLAVAPDGQWAYVLEQDAGTGRSYVEPVDLAGLQSGQQEKANLLDVETNSQTPVLAPSGQTLFVPFTGDMKDATAGGVAIVEVSETACCDMVWKSLEGCPSCDTGKCVVLATIMKYVAGAAFEDQLIDNTVRRLLPSTSTLAEIIQCICDAGSGGQGRKGDTGPQGPQGDPGQGLEQGLTRIAALSWVHNESQGGLAMVQTASQQLTPGIVIQFTGPVYVNDAIDATHIFQVFVEEDVAQQTDLLCRCAVRGTVVPVDNIEKQDTAKPYLITGAREIAPGNARGIAFLFTNGVPSTGGPSEFWIQLRCDFVIDVNRKAVDGAFLRLQLPTGDHLAPPSSDKPFGLQGGLFESWFTFQGELPGQ